MLSFIDTIPAGYGTVNQICYQDVWNDTLRDFPCGAAKFLVQYSLK